MTTLRFKNWWATFAATGDICPLKLGATRDEVRSLLGEPDDTGGTSRKRGLPMIWIYAELEFHFGPKPGDGLNLIYQDTDEGIVKVSIPRREGAD